MKRTHHAVVTGGDRGIGFGIAADLVGSGAATVAIVGRDEAALRASVDELTGLGDARIIALRVDLAVPDEVQSLVTDLTGDAARWNVFVHAAGNPPDQEILTTSSDSFERTWRIHVNSCFELAKALAPDMIEDRWGRMIAIGSTAGSRAFRGHGAYSSAKAALTMFMQCCGLEWGGYGLTANTIAPTVILTKLGQQVWGEHPEKADWIRHKIPAGRLGEVDDVVAAARFLISDEAGFMNSATLQCDGGQITTVADGPPS